MEFSGRKDTNNAAGVKELHIVNSLTLVWSNLFQKKPYAKINYTSDPSSFFPDLEFY